MSSDLVLDRRSVVLGAGGLALTAVGLGMSGCTPGGGSADIGGGEAVALPAQVPFAGVAPDLPGDPEAGINDGYFSYPLPDDQVRTVDREVGTGGDLTFFVETYSPPPPALAKNAYWQAINEALKVKASFTLVPSDVNTKAAAVLAGDDLPDIFTLHRDIAWSLRGYESVVPAKFANLSDYLSGAAAADYPNLARLQPEAWGPTVVGGQIYATPTMRIPTGSAVFCRPDVIAELGVNPQPADAAEFEELCRATTNPDQEQYTMGGSGWLTGLFYPMFGVPNGWRQNDDGTLTKYFETEQWLQAVDYIAQTRKQGYWHPDSASASFDPEPLFASGRLMLYSDNFVRYTVRGKLTFEVGLMQPFAADGGPAAQFVTHPTDFLTFVKQADADRVQECLRVLDYLSAPFGSAENFLRTYGAEGADHTIKGGQPMLTERGETETSALCLRFVAGGPDVLFAANGDPDMVEKLHTYQKDGASRQLADPTAGVYAESATTTTQVEQQVTDTMNEVILGRKPHSALQEVVKTWRTRGGDKLREDYQLALQQGR
jgi:putative aldouronate transport system substrate-binding protein